MYIRPFYVCIVIVVDCGAYQCLLSKIITTINLLITINKMEKKISLQTHYLLTDVDGNVLVENEQLN